METKQTHKIDKIHVKMQTHSEEEGHYLKDHISKWINSEVLTCMEDYIAGIEAEIGKHIIQFDKLKISLEVKDGKLQDNTVCNQIKDQLDAQVKAFLRKAKHAGLRAESSHSTAWNEINAEEVNGNIVNPEERALESLFHFLKTGRAPWWMTAQELNDLLEEKQLETLIIKEKDVFYPKLVESLSITDFRKRLIRQFSGKLLHRVLKNAFYSVQQISFESTKQEALPEIVRTFSVLQKEQFWSAMIDLLQAYRVEKTVSEKRWEELLAPVSKFVSASTEKSVAAKLTDLPVLLEQMTQFRISEKVKNDWAEKLLENQQTESSKKALAEKARIELEKAKLEAQSKDEKASGEKGELAEKSSEEKDSETKELDPSKEKASEKNDADTVDQEALDFQKAVKLDLEKELDNDALKKGVIVENAGLILLHPYFKHFLTQTQLINEKNEFSDPELAVHVLHYIATGKQQDWDHNLLFEKFLCNVPLHESISRERIIPDEIKEEVNGLLEAVLENWPALRSSSTELLRNEFLQRPGKLFMDEISVRLTIERKTYDILLDKLPWGISMSKLPWQQNLIYTTW